MNYNNVFATESSTILTNSILHKNERLQHSSTVGVSNNTVVIQPEKRHGETSTYQESQTLFIELDCTVSLVQLMKVHGPKHSEL